MTAWFTRIKRFYEAGYWTKKMVGDGVTAGVITATEYETITDEVYAG